MAIRSKLEKLSSGKATDLTDCGVFLARLTTRKRPFPILTPDFYYAIEDWRLRWLCRQTEA